jgi:large subunit ribosomal protein L3
MKERFKTCAQKVGMTQLYLGERLYGATLLWCKNATVLQRSKNAEAVLVGYGAGQKRKWNKAQHHLCADVVPERIQETRTTDTSLEVGSQIKAAALYKVGAHVDVQGTSLGKGFSGPMKRWNFAGLRATHGVSKAHRSHGSIGFIGNSRVFKGKKMAGHYGNETITVQNLKVLYSEELELDGMKGTMIAVHGAVPGVRGAWCTIGHAVKKEVK